MAGPYGQHILGYQTKETESSIRQRLLAAGFERPKESVTVHIGEKRFKLRDVFVGAAIWWREYGQDTVDSEEPFIYKRPN